MKRITLSLIFLISLLVSTASHAEETIRMGYFMLQPHTFNDGKKGPAQGAGIKYFNEVAKQMGYKVEWVGPLPLPRLTEYLKSGKVDGTIGFPKFSAFEKFLHYTNSSVYMAQPTLGVSTKNGLSAIKKAEDIKDFRIGFVKSKSGKTTPLIDKNRELIHLKEFHGNKWMQQSIGMVNKGRLEALYDRQEYTMRYVAAMLNQKIKVLPIPAKPSPMYIAFSRNTSKGGQKLMELCNEALKKVSLNYVGLLNKEFEAIKK